MNKSSLGGMYATPAWNHWVPTFFPQPNVVLVSRPLYAVRFRARAVYLFSYGISRAEFSLGNRYLSSSSFGSKTAATLDSDFLRKIPRAKPRQKSHTPDCGSLDRIREIVFKIQPNQFHTVLLYNRGTEPHTILDGHPGRPGGGLSGLSGGLSGDPAA